MDYEQAHQEIVKCVVVGDTSVGKTRLICAKACNLTYNLSQLMTTHIPTVWAIDQYRIHKEVLERSWEVIDGVNVSLRLWDTFGDHDKDRRFAYGRSDVVLLCFSIANPTSLRNCKNVWYPEIRRFCPNTPIVLVGCKNDLRYLFKDDKFQNLCRERSPFFRPVKERDILFPDEGRLMASELNAPYYETSMYTQFGVKDLFTNVIRTALISRRQQRFWMTNLRHVRACTLQEPFCPPKPVLPTLSVPCSTYQEDIRSIYQRKAYTDVILKCQSLSIHCHKIILIASSEVFNSLFTYHHFNHRKVHTFNCFDNDVFSEQSTLCKYASDVSINSGSDYDKNTSKLFSDDSLLDIRLSLYLKSFFSSSLLFPALTDASKLLKNSFSKIAKSHSKSRSKMRFLQQRLSILCKNIKNLKSENSSDSKFQNQSVVSINKKFRSLDAYIALLYTLSFSSNNFDAISSEDLLKCLRYLDFVEFDAVMFKESLDYQECVKLKLINYFDKIKCDIFPKRLAYFGIEKCQFVDVIFKLDDGMCFGHKAILMARCEVMEAMFKGQFKESTEQVICISGVSREAFHMMIHYLYTDTLHDKVSHKNCLALIEIANRFNLVRLVALVEEHIVDELNQMIIRNSSNSLQIAFKLLEASQIHNAHQLAEHCLYLLMCNYNDICHNHIKLLRSLHPENQAYLNRNRWPPVWYLKELDHYERCMRELEWNKCSKGMKRRRLHNGCFCFSSKTRSSTVLLNDSPANSSSPIRYKIFGII